MEIIKIGIEWARAELVSTSFFVLTGLLFVLCSLGLWEFGKTDLARSYFIPLLVSGAFLMTVGFGLFFNNKSRISRFESIQQIEVSAFIQAERSRVDATLKEYQNIVFTGIPIILMICAGVLFFVDLPIWRASMVSSIAMLAIILLIDGMAHARIEVYKQALELAHQNLMP